MHQPNAAEHLGLRNLNTLLVEQDAQTRQVIELELSVRGQVVESCADAEAALKAFNDNLFNLVIISHQLPDGDALQLCRNIRALPGGDEVGIVISGLDADGTDINAAIDAGADDTIVWAASGDLIGNQIDRLTQITSNRRKPGRAVEQGSSEQFMVINPNGTIRSGAPVTERLLGFPPEAIVGVNAFGFFHPDDAPQLLSIVTEAFTQSQPTRAIEVRVRLDGDSWRTIAISAINKTTDSRVRGIVFELRGPDATVGTDDQVTRAAMHDRVTDLPTRSLFIDRVDHAVVRSSRRQQPVVVMAIDFNNYTTDDSQPRAEIDDGLLIAVSQRLRSCLRSSDTAARLGHDHFGVLLEEILEIDNVGIVANRIINAMSVPFVSSGHELTLTAHIGIAVSSPNRHRAVDLLRDAGIARAWARVQGSGSHVMFDPSMQPPDDEPSTSEFPVPPAPTPAGLDHRLDELNQRIASLEQTLARFAHVTE
jgi:diguanylate cyclase (GGDEF)-like protein/PAS domain S-box-containing protein